tara:strand:+ start:25724 stop:26407 length:684 start_codon:yes stop_codon:yes gene_type:complete
VIYGKIKDKKLREAHGDRVRRAKRYLRYLPRRAVLHKYPLISRFSKSKWFARGAEAFVRAARKRFYLWSFRTAHAIPAIYVGSIISFMPIFGIQILVAFIASFVFRANVMIMVALQFITNPFTIGPIYGAAYYLGNFLLSGLPSYTPTFVDSTTIDTETVLTLGQTGMKWLKVFFHKFWVTSVGGMVIGYFFAFICSIIYRIVARKASTSHFFHPDSTNDDSGKKNP